MNRIIATILLVICSTTLSAVVAGGAGDPKQRDPGPDGQGRLATAPAWVSDPTEGGKKKGVVASWAALASKDDQKKARTTAVETLITTFKLPVTVKIKEMNMWVDTDGKTYVQLVAR